MSDRDDAPMEAPARHLRLVIEEERPDQIPVQIPVPLPRTRLIRRTPVQKRGTLADIEIPISRSRDSYLAIAGSNGDVHGDDRETFSERCAHLATICARIAEGYYNSREVLDEVARRIVRSGELSESPGQWVGSTLRYAGAGK